MIDESTTIVIFHRYARSLFIPWPTYFIVLWVAYFFGTDLQYRARGRRPGLKLNVAAPTAAASPCRKNFYGQRMYVRNMNVAYIIF